MPRHSGDATSQRTQHDVLPRPQRTSLGPLSRRPIRTWARAGVPPATEVGEPRQLRLPFTDPDWDWWDMFWQARSAPETITPTTRLGVITTVA